MGKGEIAHNKQFLLFPQCFLSFWRTFCNFHQIQNCCLQTLSDWKSLKFAIWEEFMLLHETLYQASNYTVMDSLTLSQTKNFRLFHTIIFPSHRQLSQITIIETMDSGEKVMNSDTMIIGKKVVELRIKPVTPCPQILYPTNSGTRVHIHQLFLKTFLVLFNRFYISRSI